MRELLNAAAAQTRLEGNPYIANAATQMVRAHQYTLRAMEHYFGKGEILMQVLNEPVVFLTENAQVIFHIPTSLVTMKTPDGLNIIRNSELTQRETAIFIYLLGRHGNKTTTEQIADGLLLNSKTIIKAHIHNLRAKFEPDPKPCTV